MPRFATKCGAKKRDKQTKSPKKKPAKKWKPRKTPEELAITKLVRKVKKEKDQEAFDRLREYLGSYIRYYAQKYNIRGYGSDDIEQECLFALRYKAIEDFNSRRGNFKTFAVLCIRRHIFSLIKVSNQHKRKPLNVSLSLDATYNDMSLKDIVSDNSERVDTNLAELELRNLRFSRLEEQLSPLESEVFKLYVKKYRYDEIVEELCKIFPERKIDTKCVDNSVQRLKSKSRKLMQNPELH